MADVQKSSPALIAVAWLIVLAPTAWGLTYTVQSALKLFNPTLPVTAAPPVPGQATAPAK